MSENRTENVTKNITFGLISKVVSLLLPFITRTLLLYLIGVSSVGISTLFTSILNFLSLGELGFGSAVVYSMYKPIADNDLETVGALLNYYKKLYRIIGLIILLIGCAIAPFLEYLISDGAPEGLNIYVLYFIYLINSVISYFFSGYRQSLLIAYQRTDIRSIISVIVTSTVRIIEILVIVITRNFYLYAAVSIIGTLITNISVAVVTRKKYPDIKCEGQISKEKRGLIRKKIGGLFGTKLNSIVIHQADTMVISAFLGLTVLTQYGNYYYILSTISGFIMILFSSMTASIGNKIAVDTRDNVYALFNKINFLNSWVVGWCAICLLCLYQPFVKLWVGESLLLPFSTALLMAVYLYIYQIQRTILTFKDAGGLWYEDRFRPYISMTINLITNIILVQFIGLNGVIISTIISFLISIPWCNYVVFKNMFAMKPFNNLLRQGCNLLLTSIVAIITFFICSLCGEGIIGFCIKVIVCIIIPNALFYLLFRRTNEFKEMKKLLLQIIKKRLK